MKSFLKVPKKVHHGLLLVAELASRPENEPVSLEAIAEKEEISQGFLEEIVAPLRAAGIVRGVRGAGGGYVLARAAESITVAEVIAALEGPMTLVDCLNDQGHCGKRGRCVNHDLWRLVQMQMVGALRKVTVAQIAARKDAALETSSK